MTDGPAPAAAAAEGKSIEYALSPVQNKHVKAHQERLKIAQEELAKAEAAYKEALKHARSEQENNDLFLAYIVEEFELPKTSEGYSLAAIADGVYKLTGTVKTDPQPPASAEAAAPDAPAVDPEIILPEDSDTNKV